MVYFVSDLQETISFYEILGFDFKKRSNDWAIGYINWFWLEFVQKDKSEETVFRQEIEKDESRVGGAGSFLHLSVNNVDEFYELIVEKGLEPSSTPNNFAWGRREFVIRDPDGYKIVFFSKN